MYCIILINNINIYHINVFLIIITTQCRSWGTFFPRVQNDLMSILREEFNLKLNLLFECVTCSSKIKHLKFVDWMIFTKHLCVHAHKNSVFFMFCQVFLHLFVDCKQMKRNVSNLVYSGSKFTRILTDKKVYNLS